METLTAVYLAAGISSRFGGRCKALEKVGPNNEPLLAISMNQAIDAGFNEFILIVSDKTFDPIKDEFGDNYKGVVLKYCFQKTPEYRQKPFGTTHALLSAKELIHSPFIILNSDDLYGSEALELMAKSLINSHGYCLPGYYLKNCLPEEGTVNRGVLKLEEGNLVEIDEIFNVSIKDVPGKYSGEELVSMNLFGLEPEFLDYAENEFKSFLKKIGDDPKAECLLPITLSNFLKEKNIKCKVVITHDTPLGITNPEDENRVKAILRESL